MLHKRPAPLTTLIVLIIAGDARKKKFRTRTSRIYIYSYLIIIYPHADCAFVVKQKKNFFGGIFLLVGGRINNKKRAKAKRAGSREISV